MKEDFLTFFQLENAYTVNHFIHSLHRIPLIKKIVEGRSYDAKGLKVLGSIYRVIKEIIISIFFKLFYYGIIVVGAFIFTAVEDGEEAAPIEVTAAAFFTIFIFTTLIGALFRNKLFDSDEHSYYALILLRVDARNYALINYGYFMAVDFVFNLLAGLIISLIFKLPLYFILLFPLFVSGTKLLFQLINLLVIDFFLKHNVIEATTKIVLTIIYCLAAVVLLVTDHTISTEIATVVFLVVGILGAISSISVIKYKDYHRVYKKSMSQDRNAVSEQKDKNLKKEKNAARNSLSEKTLSATSNKTGFAYLNDLFLKRHHKTLWGVVRIELIIIALVVLAICAAVIIFPKEVDDLEEVLIKGIPSIMFLMYVLNRGQSFTNCLFVNCDHCFLTYSFFKEPKLILRLFTLRLFSLIKLNILPGIFTGFGLAAIYYLVSNNPSTAYCFVFLASPIAMSIFFSIHYMMLYYLLQPFTVDSKVDSVPYKIINVITYIVSYSLFQMKVGGLMFGIGAIIFCVIYSLIAILLVYKKATKTFKIRK